MRLYTIKCICASIFIYLWTREDFMQEGIPVLRVVSIALLLMSIATIWLNGVTGTGQSKINLAIEFVAIIIYLIYAYLTIEYYQFPITIGWMCEIIYWLTLLIPSYLYIKSDRWKDKRYSAIVWSIIKERK